MTIPTYNFNSKLIYHKKRRTPCYHYTKISRNVTDFVTGESLNFKIKYDYCSFFKSKIILRNCSKCTHYEKR